MAIDRSFSLAAAALYQELAPCAAQAVPGGELLLNSTTVLTDEKHCWWPSCISRFCSSWRSIVRWQKVWIPTVPRI
jgi:hypothetical protein